MCRKDYSWSHSSPTCVIKGENLRIFRKNVSVALSLLKANDSPLYSDLQWRVFVDN